MTSTRRASDIPANIPPPHQENSAPQPTTSVSLDELQQSYASFTDDSWEMRALRALDNGDGVVSVAEIEAARNRPGTSVVTSVELCKSKEEVGVALGGSGSGSSSCAIDASALSARTRDLARRADAASGAPDSQTSVSEVEAFAKKVANGQGPQDLLFLTNQRLAILRDAIARLTGEPVPTDLVLRCRNGNTVEMLYPAMVVAYDTETNVARAAATVYYSEDVGLINTAGIERSNRFYRDRALSESNEGVTPAVYSGSFDFAGRLWGYQGSYQFHRGHLLANDDFVTQEDADRSFTTANMHPQTQMSNSVVWLNKVEQKIRLEVAAHQSRVVMVSGALFADDKLKPLAPESLSWIGGRDRNGAGIAGTREEVTTRQRGQHAREESVAVPTHSWKAVLEQGKDGSFQVTCYIVENRMDLDAQSTPEAVTGGRLAVARKLREKGSVKVSLKQLEELTGLKLFNDLPANIRRAVESVPGRPYKPPQPINFISEPDQGFLCGDPDV